MPVQGVGVFWGAGKRCLRACNHLVGGLLGCFGRAVTHEPQRQVSQQMVRGGQVKLDGADDTPVEISLPEHGQRSLKDLTAALRELRLEMLVERADEAGKQWGIGQVT